jgi:hypothetical protein
MQKFENEEFWVEFVECFPLVEFQSYKFCVVFFR